MRGAGGHGRPFSRTNLPLFTVYDERERAGAYLEGFLRYGVDVGRRHETVGPHAQLERRVLAARLLRCLEERDPLPSPDALLSLQM